MSAQRLLQNGAYFSAAALRQIGHGWALMRLLSVMACIWEDRKRTSNRAEPAEADGIALAGQQRRGLIQRQPHNIAVGSDDLDNEATRNPLRGITAGLAAPFAGRQVGLDVLLRQALEPHARFHQALAVGFVGRDQAHAGMDAMIA